ncbi:MAG: glycosyltransferase, partial [Gemmatimonadetes bacterium]|nr:glycosyltransferase [Gemmatimonadota bacterium]
ASLIRALNVVRRDIPSATLVLVGDGPLKVELHQLADSLGLKDAVVFTGGVDDVWSHLAQADLFALPSLYEPLGIVNLEAMACATAVVASDVGGIPEVVADPDAHRGRLVSWELQFVSSERAETVRTDFYEGEPFLLTRHPDGAFVYVAVPPDRLGEVEGLIPLERIAVVGRVRVGASDLTGSPILDLVELRRVARR